MFRAFIPVFPILLSLDMPAPIQAISLQDGGLLAQFPHNALLQPWRSMPAQRLQSWFVTPICPIRKPSGYRYRYTICALRSRNAAISLSQ